MGCGASVLVAEDGERRRPLGALRRRRRQRRVRPSRRYSIVSTTELLHHEEEPSLAGRIRPRVVGKKVAPEPPEMAPVAEGEEEKEKGVVLPGSPSFRFYCDKTAAVAALVAEDSDEVAEKPDEVKEEAHTTQEITKSHDSSQVPACKATKWIKLRGLTVATAAVHNLFSVKNCYNNTSSASAPPAAAAAAAAAGNHHP